MRKLWIKFITKQYNKYFNDDIRDLLTLVSEQVFISKAEAFTYMQTNATGGLKRLFEVAKTNITKRGGA